MARVYVSHSTDFSGEGDDIVAKIHIGDESDEIRVDEILRRISNKVSKQLAYSNAVSFFDCCSPHFLSLKHKILTGGDDSNTFIFVLRHFDFLRDFLKYERERSPPG